jgi:hypothetical protein
MLLHHDLLQLMLLHHDLLQLMLPHHDLLQLVRSSTPLGVADGGTLLMQHLPLVWLCSTNAIETATLR